ncbi:hypothetical protein RRG08_062542 [Elysia crispata]|uniref:Tyrosine-protein phosphatase domain-containing protein n=1 Tax=Elysia crispata TaxID=231223 RepID=A0AAE0YC11_9GAST|nr:hypothetical protein RRG08_062542 [Elysia crispata]
MSLEEPVLKQAENVINLCGVPSSGRDDVAGERRRQIKKLRTTSVCVGYPPWERLCRRRLTQANKEAENDISLCGVPSSGIDYVRQEASRTIVARALQTDSNKGRASSSDPNQDKERPHQNLLQSVTDYIVASYMKGYSANDMSIASQAPSDRTWTDFVRMIWEQRVDKVVMLTNLFEEGKKKCSRYWPVEAEYDCYIMSVLSTLPDIVSLDCPAPTRAVCCVSLRHARSRAALAVSKDRTRNFIAQTSTRVLDFG